VRRRGRNGRKSRTNRRRRYRLFRLPRNRTNVQCTLNLSDSLGQFSDLLPKLAQFVVRNVHRFGDLKRIISETSMEFTGLLPRVHPLVTSSLGGRSPQEGIATSQSGTFMALLCARSVSSNHTLRSKTN
jgi:hypothetical protein